MAFPHLFRNVPVQEVLKKRSDAVLKHYESASDARAWSHDKVEKAEHIQDILKRKGILTCEEPSDARGQLTATLDANDNVEGMSKDQLEQIKKLQRELKIRDVELDKIHKLFKQASTKLDEMNAIIKDNHEFESKLRDSVAQLEKLKTEKQLKDETLKSMNQELEALKCSPSVPIETEEAWQQIKNRDEMFDNVVSERNQLKNQLCKMAGISDVLRKLKSRADEADQMEQEVDRLKRELQRFGASGDHAPKKRVESACKQCHKYADEIARSESSLEAEIRKNVSMEAERNFLRERVRTIEVMEAELILYKTKYEQAECKMTKLKEMLVRSELNEKQITGLKQRLAHIESNLQQAERNNQELTNVVERQEMNLNERDVYIECLNRRIQQEHETGSKKSVSVCVPPGSVQNIVRKMSVVAPPSNCKCGFDNCQCAVVVPKNSSKLETLRSPKSSLDSVHCPSQEISQNLQLSPGSSDNELSMEKCESKRLSEELSSEEIRLLRKENRVLDQELTRIKFEMATMVKVMDELEQQRDLNECDERQMIQLSCEQGREVAESRFRSSICEKNELLKELQDKRDADYNRTECMEKKLAECMQELDKLRPLVCLQQRCQELNGKLQCVEAVAEDRSQQISHLTLNCEQYCDQNAKLSKKLKELEIELREQQKYAKELAAQLCKRKSEEKSGVDSSKNSLELLRKCIKDLNKRYDAVKEEKIDVIQCYEKKVEMLEDENRSLRCNREQNTERKCQCDWNSSDDGGDILLKKVAKFGLFSLYRDELIDLHNRVRCAMIQNEKSSHVDLSDMDYYTKMVDDLRTKYNLSDALPFMTDHEDVPVKDFDVCSSKTMPPILRNRKSSKGSKNKPRARSSDAAINLAHEKPAYEKTAKCVTITRRAPKK